MRLKPKTARRLLLVGVVGVLLVVSAFSLFFVRSWQNERRTRNYREQGMSAYAAKDYPVVLDNLGRYLKARADDREAWLAFADAREQLEEPRGGHLAQTSVALSRALALDESDRQTALRLVKVQNMIGFYAEARDQAVRLRPADLGAATAEHFEVLLQEAMARTAVKAGDPALDQLTLRLVTLAPLDYRAALLRTAYLREADRREEAKAFAAGLLASNPDDAGAMMIGVLTRAEGGEALSIDDFVAVLCKASGLDKDSAARVSEVNYTEPQLVAQLFSGFDRLGMFAHSLMVIRDGAVRLKDRDLRRLLGRREWQAGRPEELLADFADPDTGPRGEHSESLAFRTLALRSLGRNDEATAALGQLRARTRDFFAIVWSKALGAVMETAENKDALSQLDSAIKDYDAEPTFAYFRGEILARLGRGEEARSAWESAYKSGLSEGWDVPAVRTAETLLDEGRVDEGLLAAQSALQRFRLAPAARLAHLRAQALLIESGRPVGSPADVLRQIDELAARIETLQNPGLSLMARRALLPARVALLADLHRKDEATRLIEEIAKDPKVLDADLARRLAQVSAREGLGMEAGILAAAGAGGDASGTLLSRALLLHNDGSGEAATKLIEDALASAAAERKAELLVTRAQFRDLTNHPEAVATWKAVAGEHPGSLSVQLSAIRSQTAASDPAFIEQLAAQIIKLGGSDADRPSAEIRFARARALLYKSPTARARDEAVGILRALVLEAPARSEFRDALIGALLLDDPAQNLRPNYQAAIEQLTAATAFTNDRSSSSLRLASIYRQQGQTAKAVDELNKLAIDQGAEPAGRLRAIDQLTELREHEAALRGLDTLMPGADKPDVELLLRRAGLLLALRRDREAVEMYQRVLRMPVNSAPVLLSVAGALRTLGETAAAEAAMARLDDAAILPKDRELARAGYAAAAGDAAGALAHYNKATELAPEDRQTWLLLARFYLQRNELPLAEAAASRGLEKLPGDAELTIIREQVRLAGMDDSSTDVTALTDALARNPATARRAEAIRAVTKARVDGKLDDVAVLSRLAEEFVDDVSTQMFVARRLASSANPAALAEAARIMRRASARYANDPSVQENAARVLIAAEDWEPALAAASGWRALTRDPRADVAIGESQLALKRTRQASDAVKDLRLPTSIAADDAVSLGVLNIRTRVAAETGPAQAAFALVEPHLSNQMVRVGIALPVAAMLLKDSADVKGWIEAVAGRSESGAVDEQLAIANAWATASDRLPAAREDFLRRAAETTDRLLAVEGGDTARVYSMRASILSAAGDVDGAVTAARQAAAKSPGDVNVALGLARLLLSTGKGAAEAESVALGTGGATTAMPEALLIAAHAQLAQAEAAMQAGDEARGAAKKRESQATLAQLAAMSPVATAMVLEMANLAERLQDDVQAVTLYERALGAPQPPTGMPLAIVKNNLAFLIYKKAPAGGATSASLRRAKSLVEEAIQEARLAPFYDTLGSINIGLGDRAGAISAFRKAVELDPKGVGAVANLAQALSAGSAEERTEAGSLLKEVDALLGSGAALDPDQRSRLERTRQRLASPPR